MTCLRFSSRWSDCPVRLGVAPMALLRSGVLVKLCFELAVRDVSGSGQVKPGDLETLDRLAHRRWRQARYAARSRAWKSRQTSDAKPRAHGAWQLSPLASIPPQPKPKKRTLRTASGGSPTSLTPGGIIPEWWARINRNAGRQLIGMGGRHHPGIGGRLAPEFAANTSLRLGIVSSLALEGPRPDQQPGLHRHQGRRRVQ